MVRSGQLRLIDFHIFVTMRPMQNTVRSRSFLVLLLLILTAGVVFLLAACGQAPPASDADSAEAPQTGAAETEPEPVEPPEPETYTVRGEIVDLPDPDDPTSGFFVYHEAIDDFRHLDGRVTGMSSMTMPFPVADDVDLGGLQRGDKVEFDLYVDWAGDPAYRVTRVEEIDRDTILEFRGARPPGDSES